MGLLTGAANSVRQAVMNLYGEALNSNPGLLNRYYRSSVAVSGRIGNLTPNATWKITVTVYGASPQEPTPAGPVTSAPWWNNGSVDLLVATDDTGSASYAGWISATFDVRNVLVFAVTQAVDPAGNVYSDPTGARFNSVTTYNPQDGGHPSPWPGGAILGPATLDTGGSSTLSTGSSGQAYSNVVFKASPGTSGVDWSASGGTKSGRYHLTANTSASTSGMTTVGSGAFDSSGAASGTIPKTGLLDDAYYAIVDDTTHYPSNWVRVTFVTRGPPPHHGRTP